MGLWPYQRVGMCKSLGMCGCVEKYGVTICMCESQICMSWIMSVRECRSMLG